MNRLVNIGYGNMVNAEKIVAVIHSDSAPAKRMVSKGKEEGIVIDATQGRRTQAILVMENGSLVLSALLPETLSGRMNASQKEELSWDQTEED